MIMGVGNCSLHLDVFCWRFQQNEEQRGTTTAERVTPASAVQSSPRPSPLSTLCLRLAEDFPLAFGVGHLLLLQILDFLAAEVDQPADRARRSITSWAARCLSSSAVM